MINMQYRKKPIVIEAIQFYGDNWKDICSFIGKEVPIEWKTPSCAELIIPTLEGNMIADKGDWIIKGIRGEFYPCKPDIFTETYEVIDNETK